MIEFAFDEPSREATRAFLASLGPRLVVALHGALKTLLYQGVQNGVQKYFAGHGPKGGRTSALLTSRSGALVNSLLGSVEQGFDPRSAGTAITQISAMIGSSLPYARIQEYGGSAGRAGPFKKRNGRRPYLPPRPYLGPIFDDLKMDLPDALQQVVQSTLRSLS
jgi:phage gpG-like protein